MINLASVLCLQSERNLLKVFIKLRLGNQVTVIILTCPCHNPVDLNALNSFVHFAIVAMLISCIKKSSRFLMTALVIRINSYRIVMFEKLANLRVTKQFNTMAARKQKPREAELSIKCVVRKIADK